MQAIMTIGTLPTRQLSEELVGVDCTYSSTVVLEYSSDVLQYSLPKVGTRTYLVSTVLSSKTVLLVL
jgi:hypothetical protein